MGCSSQACFTVLLHSLTIFYCNAHAGTLKPPFLEKMSKQPIGLIASSNYTRNGCMWFGSSPCREHHAGTRPTNTNTTNGNAQGSTASTIVYTMVSLGG